MAGGIWSTRRPQKWRCGARECVLLGAGRPSRREGVPKSGAVARGRFCDLRFLVGCSQNRGCGTAGPGVFPKVRLWHGRRATAPILGTLFCKTPDSVSRRVPQRHFWEQLAERDPTRTPRREGCAPQAAQSRAARRARGPTPPLTRSGRPGKPWVGRNGEEKPLYPLALPAKA